VTVVSHLVLQHLHAVYKHTDRVQHSHACTYQCKLSTKENVSSALLYGAQIVAYCDGTEYLKLNLCEVQEQRENRKLVYT
jgi:hypothetical protein